MTLKSIFINFNRVTESRLETHCWNCFIGLLLLVIIMLYLFMSLNNLFLHVKKSPQQTSTKLPTEFQNCPEWKKDGREVSGVAKITGGELSSSNHRFFPSRNFSLPLFLTPRNNS